MVVIDMGLPRFRVEIVFSIAFCKGVLKSTENEIAGTQQLQ